LVGHGCRRSLKDDLRSGRLKTDRLLDLQRQLHAAKQRIADFEKQLAGSFRQSRGTVLPWGPKRNVMTPAARRSRKRNAPAGAAVSPPPTKSRTPNAPKTFSPTA
jgi:hypothetical protein